MTPAESTPPPVQPQPTAANVEGVAGLEDLQQVTQGAQQPAGGEGTPQAAPVPPGAPAPPQEAAQLLQQHTGVGNTEIQLGDTVVAVYPQRHAYLENRLGRVLGEFVSTGLENLDADNFIAFLGERSYDVIAALLPQLPSRMPKHVWAGYGSEEAFLAKEYDPALDTSPTYPQIIEAFTAVVKVNRLDVLGGLKSIVDPSLIQGFLRVEMAKALEQRSTS